VPTYFEAIANLKDLLAYCHVWDRMTFDIGEKDDEAREVIEALDKEADNHNSRRQPEGAREGYGEP
jgi:hypothetical protein